MYTFSAASSLSFQLSAKLAMSFGWSLIVLAKEAMFLNEIIYIMLDRVYLTIINNQIFNSFYIANLKTRANLFSLPIHKEIRNAQIYTIMSCSHPQNNLTEEHSLVKFAVFSNSICWYR
jgi:hypothetical protein